MTEVKHRGDDPDLLLAATVEVVMAQFASAAWLSRRLGVRPSTADRLLGHMEHAGVLSALPDHLLPRRVLVDDLGRAVKLVRPSLGILMGSDPEEQA